MRVAVVGLGRMGTAIAERVLQAGHETFLYNRSPGRAGELVENGAQELSSLSDVWKHATVCVTMLADSSALESVALRAGGLANSSAGEGHTLIDMSTVSPEISAQVAGGAKRTGVAYLRAPVSGNPGVVRSGNLGIMVSGEPSVFHGAEGLLRDIGPNVFYLGIAEEARVMKLALNVIIAGTAEVLAEAIVLGEAHGLERAQMLEVMNGSAVASPFIRYKTAALVADDYSTTFTAGLMRKDLDLALAAAGSVPLPVTALVQQLLQGCISSGMAELDFMALLPRLQREAGAETGVARTPR